MSQSLLLTGLLELPRLWGADDATVEEATYGRNRRALRRASGKPQEGLDGLIARGVSPFTIFRHTPSIQFASAA